MKKNLKKLGTVAGLSLGTIGIITSFQNCGNAGFEAISQLEKEELISKTSVFENQYVRLSRNTEGESVVNTVIPVKSDTANFDIEITPPPKSSGSTNSSTNINSGQSSGGTKSDTQIQDEENLNSTNTNVNINKFVAAADIPVKYYCSTNNFKEFPRLVDLENAYLEVRATDKVEILCDDKVNLMSSLLNLKKFQIPSSCISKLTINKHYKIRLYNPKAPAYLLGHFSEYVGGPANVYVKFDGEKLDTSGSVFWVLYDKNPSLSAGSITHNECDVKASPLVVLMGEGSQRIELTPPTLGIQYDILGKRATPFAHTKKRISWFLNNNHNYYFIALPNAQGQVKGIDQLFGDNTQGPDRKFAANGYAALAKYDANGDSYITDKDPVFQKLRLWHDSNLDGISSQDELFTLDEMNVMTIDLKFDSSYRESDIFGNETLMKSAIKTRDGKLHLLFDLWFRHLSQ